MNKPELSEEEKELLDAVEDGSFESMLTDSRRNELQTGARNTVKASPDWQKQKLRNRYEEYKEGKLRLHDWKSVHEDLRNKHK